VHAKSGRTLVALGDNSNQVYFVLQGRLQTNLVSMNGKEVILRDLEEGGFFGELAAIDGQPRSASVVALTDCVLASIPGEAFRAAVTEIPAASAWLARRMVSQIRDLTERVFELNALRVRNRLHCELLRMCGAARDGVALIDPAPTHAELASRIGTHREAITREIGFLIEQGIVEQQRRRLKVCDVPALVQMVRAVVGHVEGGLASPEDAARSL
jgi:CRP-like cAMP-binding protein